LNIRTLVVESFRDAFTVNLGESHNTMVHGFLVFHNQELEFGHVGNEIFGKLESFFVRGDEFRLLPNFCLGKFRYLIFVTAWNVDSCALR
jgi:hypothetical protein